MKISKIEEKDGLYYVTKTPNFIQKLFGMKEVTERYKWDGEVFHHFNSWPSFIEVPLLNSGRCCRASKSML